MKYGAHFLSSKSTDWCTCSFAGVKTVFYIYLEIKSGFSPVVSYLHHHMLMTIIVRKYTKSKSNKVLLTEHDRFYINITVIPYWLRWHLKSLASGLFTGLLVQVNMKENIKAPYHWPLWGEFTGDQWIPWTKGQWWGKCFHLTMSSWYSISLQKNKKSPHKSACNYISSWGLNPIVSRTTDVFYPD